MSFKLDENDFYIRDFHFIDDFRCLHPLSESFYDGHTEYTEQDEAVRRATLSDMFKSAGWEGDGEINCILLAPCFLAEGTTTWSEIIYHVKQSNNGTSWLAIPKGLKLELPEGFLVD